jgi:hypothetical protein
MYTYVQQSVEVPDLTGSMSVFIIIIIIKRFEILVILSLF